MRPLRSRIAALLAAPAVIITAALALTMSAHATVTGSHTSIPRFGASAFQNTVISRLMTRMPGGTRVSAGKVLWDGGKVAVSVGSKGSSATANSCPSGDFCAFSDPGDTGCIVDMFGNELDEFDWGAFSAVNCGSRGTWSWENNSPDRVWKEQFWSGETSAGNFFYTGGKPSGTNFCINPGNNNSNVTNDTIRTLGWIQMTQNKNTC